MSLLWRYVAVYFLFALLLIAASVWAFVADYGEVGWLLAGTLAFWLLAYHPVVLWLDYRRVTGLIADLRAGRMQARIDPERLRESVADFVSDYGGVPGPIAAWVVRRVLTDAVSRELVARLQARAPSPETGRNGQPRRPLRS